MKNQSFLNSPRFAQLTPGEKQAIADYYQSKYYEHLQQLELKKIQSLPQEDRLRYYWESTHHDPKNATEQEFQLFEKVYGKLNDPRPDIETMDGIFDEVLLKKQDNPQQPIFAKEPSRNFTIPENLYTSLCDQGRAGQSALKVVMWFYRHQKNNTVTVTKSTLQQETSMAFETVVKELEMLKQLKVIRQVSPTHYILNDASKWKFEQEKT